MTGSIGLPVIDTVISFPHEGFDQYDFIRKQTKDRESREKLEFPVEYMFKQVPKDLPTNDPVAVTLHEMDRYGLIGVADETSRPALQAASRQVCAFRCRRRPQRCRRIGAGDASGV